MLLCTACASPEERPDTQPGRSASPSGAAVADSLCPVAAPTLRRVAADTLAGSENLLTVAPPRAGNERIHVVVEIPAGTHWKWEATKPDGRLAVERVDGALRRIQYLPYPASYGFVPNTDAPHETGGDGDPLDVVLLGPAQPCGAVVAARLLGVLRLQDDGERDDKLLAAAPGSAFEGVADLNDLRVRFPGVLTILETWFTQYEGPGNRMTGTEGPAAAWAYVDAASSAP